jgi:Holliday junction DNA helicase RuvA
MIAQLTGKIVHSEDGLVTLDIGGVGFAVFVPANLEARVGDHVLLHTHLQVRETELTLYGFSEQDDKHLFELLVSVTGVGPRAALSLMGTLSSDTLRRAVLDGQPEVLARAPGVGRKTGEAIILHLKDKLRRQAGVSVHVSEDDADIIAALTALGFSIVEAQSAIQQLPRDDASSLDEKIRYALSFLGR